MKREYTIADFKMNDYAWKPIIEDGRRGYVSGKYEINYSRILTRLIQEAGRYCEHFASDLFIDWNSVLDYIENLNDDGITGKSFLFGFRESGVDHLEYIISRYENSGDYAKHNYRSMWRLDVETKDNTNIIMTLGRVF